MMRATPYCSVRPSAMRAYMPPSTRPGRTISSNSMTRCPTNRAAGRRSRGGDLPAAPASLPLRLRHDGRASARQRCRCESIELAVLPLADAPHLLQQSVLQLHLADDGVERAGADFGGNGGAVQLADLLDRLLEHLEACIGDRARPAIGLLAGRGLVARE